MSSPQAAGERFLGVTGDPVSMLQISRLLRERLGEQAKKAPTRELPNWLVKLVSVFDSSLEQIVPELGHVRPASSEKARSVLGWQPRSGDDAILATAQSLIGLGLIGAASKK
jgi:dihydroflavonol-4-reductase